MKRFSALPLLLAALLPASLPAQQHRSDALDDLLQHAPMAAVFTLKACHYDAGSSWTALALKGATTYCLGAATAYSAKQLFGEQRPDHSDRRSFPSGHAMFAFAGASMLSHEYGRLSPWVTIGGYGVATLVSMDRVVRDRHYLHDVCAGAAIGWASTELTYYLGRRFLRQKNVDLAFTGQALHLAVSW